MANPSSTNGVPDPSEPSVSSSMPTPIIPQLHRSLSNSSHWSAADAPHHHLQGTSYFSGAPPSSPRVTTHPGVLRSSSSSRRGHRSTSVSSSHVASRGIGDGILSEEDEGSDDENDNNVSMRDRGKSTAAEHDPEDDDDTEREEDPITLKDRQSLINVEHPFGLPIWKPALYKKTRSVTRYADEALHSDPSAQAERHLLPGNVFWVIMFGWWLALVCFVIAFLMVFVPNGGARYSSLVFGLGWYLAWPFGKYVEGDLEESPVIADEERPREDVNQQQDQASDMATIRGTSPLTAERGDTSQPPGGVPLSQHSTITPATYHAQHAQSLSWSPVLLPSETTSLMASAVPSTARPTKIYGATSSPSEHSSSFGVSKKIVAGDALGKACFWLAFICIIAPLMLVVCLACWGLVITIPMAKLNWALIMHLFEHPTSIRFCAAPPAVIVSSLSAREPTDQGDRPVPHILSVKHQRLAAGQTAPSSSTSTVLLCTYRAVGWQYYKYTVGGVNIMFVNLLPVVIFAIFDGLILFPMVQRREKAGQHVPLVLAMIASRSLIFLMSLASVIPLSYFIGMAVASISAQSSIGMGAVINATFGSVIEVILYGIALTQGKGHLVEGSIVGSLLAGVLLMPGMSMCSGALRRKEQKFNAKSAGVTSMMLIMAIIGTLTPTLFYQTYGNVCELSPLYALRMSYVLTPILAPTVSTRLHRLPSETIRDRPSALGL
jgi:Ca2+:H+ antiporter